MQRFHDIEAAAVDAAARYEAAALYPHDIMATLYELADAEENRRVARQMYGSRSYRRALRALAA